MKPVHPTVPGGGLTSDDQGYAFGAPIYAWFVVLILCGFEIASCMDRQIINLVVEPVRHDFHVTDVQVSYLQGFAFTIFYAIIAVPMGWAADRWQRKWILVVGASIWSMATLVCAAAQNYDMLFIGRMLVGLGEATLIPTAFSLISDYVPRGRVAGAVSIVTGSTFLGTGIALGLGGVVLHLVPDKAVTIPMVGSVHGWQLSFAVVGVPTIALILITLFVREPPRRRGHHVATEHATPSEIFAFLKTQPLFWGALVGGVTLLNTYQYGITAWAATFYIRTFGWSIEKIGLIYGIYFVVLGTIASFVGGFLCDRLFAKRGFSAILMIPLSCAALALPLTEGVALSSNPTVSAVLLGLLTFVGVLPFGPTIASIPLLAPNRMRGQLLATYMLIMTLIGAGGGPWVIAAATEYVFGNPDALKYSIALVDGTLLAGAIACFWIGYARLVRRPTLTPSLTTAP